VSEQKDASRLLLKTTGKKADLAKHLLDSD